MNDRDINDIRVQISHLQDRISKNRNRYKKLVNDLYNKEQPFSPGGTYISRSFAEDITKLWEIIGYCLIAGDSAILRTWVIKPIYDRKLLLFRPEYIEDYLDEFTNLDEPINNALENALVAELVKALKTLL
ncbi:MAG TPA: hypothetical protein VIQ31_30970 [Phormidium sp.]